MKGLKSFLFFKLAEAITRKCSVKTIFKNFATFERKHLCRGLFFRVATWRHATLLKSRPLPGVFQLILRNFLEHQFYKIPPGNCFWNFCFELRKIFLTKNIIFIASCTQNCFYFTHLKEKNVEKASKNKIS